MIILSNTTDKIQIVLGGNVTTNQLPCFASYRDTTSSSIEPKRNVTNTNNTTAVDLVDSPAVSTQRVVDFISVYNADTVAATVTVRFNDNGTTYKLCVIQLGVGEKIEYQEGIGFKIISSNGSYRITNNTASPPANSTLNFVAINSDQATTSTTYADITGLGFSITAEKTYWFRFVIPYTSNLTTIGGSFAVNGPASPRILYYYSDATATTTARNARRGFSTYNAVPANTSSATAGSNLSIVEGIIRPSSSGTLIASFRTETAGNAITQKAGAFVKYAEI